RQHWSSAASPRWAEAHDDLSDTHLHFHTRIVRRVNLDPHDICVVVKRPCMKPEEEVDTSGALDDQTVRHRRDDMGEAMLVVIGEAVEHPERIFLGARLEVRLHSVDDCLCVRRNRSNLPLSVIAIPSLPVPILVDRELGVTRGVVGREKSKLPSDVIERRAQLLQALTDQDADSRRDFLLRYQAEKLKAAVRVEARDNLIGVGLEEGRYFAGEFVEVLPGALDLED